LDILNKNTGAVVTGAQARQAAMRKTIKEFNERGIPGFVDKRGREWSPEAYVNMDIRTTVTNVAHEAQFARMDDYGLNLVQISSHSGARPKCAKDQGKIFDKGNKSGYVSDLYGKKIRYYPWSSSSYGEPDGILGINCGHFAYPFVPGVSLQRYFPTEDMAENDQLYKQSQKQRAFERDIRSAKRECMMFDELGDKEQFEKSAVKLKNKRDKLNDFIQDTGRTKHSDREQVVGFDRSLSAKATAAQKRVAKQKAVENQKNRDILKAEIEKGHIKLDINPEKQARHLRDSKGYIKGRSYLTISEQEAQDIILQKSGTGIIHIRNGGKQVKEIVVCDRDVGVMIDPHSYAESPTNALTIHYSNTGTHVVPAERRTPHD